MEADAIRQGLLPFGEGSKLSPQELVSCNPNSNGCNGGVITSAFTWVTNNGGIVPSASYPYTKDAYTYGKTDSCAVPAEAANAVTVASWAYESSGEWMVVGVQAGRIHRSLYVL